MINPSIDSLAWSDIRRLLDSGASENGQLEFKRQLPGGSDDDKREFLKDISAFANASGGDIVYGIEESDGVAAAIASAAVLDRDAEVRRLQAIARDGLAPRLTGLHFRWVEAAPPSSDVVLVVRIQSSAASPHMITLKNWSRFYRRTGTVCHQLDVHELREGSLRAALRAATAERFREERLGRISAGDGAVPLDDRELLVVHFIPLRGSPGSLDGDDVAQRLALLWRKEPQVWRPLETHGGFSTQWSIDGFCVHDLAAAGEQKRAYSYAMMFRDGSAELVSPLGWGGSGHAVEKQVRESLAQYQHALRRIESDQAFAMQVSMLGVRGRRLGDVDRHERYKLRPHEFDRDRITIPPMTVSGISDDTKDLDEKLERLFTILWQSAGSERPLRR